MSKTPITPLKIAEAPFRGTEAPFRGDEAPSCGYDVVLLGHEPEVLLPEKSCENRKMVPVVKKVGFFH